MPVAPFVVGLADEPLEDEVEVPVELVPDRTVAVLLPEDVLEDPPDVADPDAVPFDDAGDVPEVTAEVAV